MFKTTDNTLCFNRVGEKQRRKEKEKGRQHLEIFLSLYIYIHTHTHTHTHTHISEVIKTGVIYILFCTWNLILGHMKGAAL